MIDNALVYSKMRVRYFFVIDFFFFRLLLKVLVLEILVVLGPDSVENCVNFVFF